MKNLIGVALCLLTVNAYSSSIWIENNALDTVAGAESIQGLASLTEIHGTIGTTFLDIADVYRFQILSEDVGPSLVINVLSEAVNGLQPNLWLFDGVGNGIKGVYNNSSTKTTMSVSGLLAGEYLLGVSVQGMTPRGLHDVYGSETEIFDPYGNPYDTVGVLTEFGGNWSAPLLEYQIAISGAAPLSAVPIPSAAWLFGSGLIGLIGFARRKT